MGCPARVILWGLFVGAAAVVLAPVGPGALIPLKIAIASADTVGNDVYVAVVVDFGSGSAPSPIGKCVPVPSNDHDADALALAVGSGNVAYNNSGLLCAINNYPANGVQNCGQSVGSGNYDYWSYWHGTSGSWVYANNGPTEQSVSSSANDVMGLRFQMDEPDNSSDPPPGVAAVYSQICNSSTEIPPAQPSSGPPVPMTTITTTTTTTTTTPSATPTTGKTSTGSGQGTGISTTVGPRSKSGVSTTTAPSATTTTLSSVATASPGSGARGSSNHRSIVASAASHNSGASSLSNLLPVALVAAVVAALGGFALFRWRRKPAEE